MSTETYQSSYERFKVLLLSPSVSVQGIDGNLGSLALLVWCLVSVPPSCLVSRCFRLMKPTGTAGLCCEVYEDTVG